MKTIRKISRNPILLIAVCFNLLLFSCSKEQVIAEKELSGKDIIKGILFLDGPVIDYITPISELKLELLVDSEENLEKVRKGIDLLLDRIEEKNPDTFDAFKLDMTSGDHIVVNSTLSKYTSIVSESAKDFFDEEDFHSAENIEKPLIELMDSHFPTEIRDELSPNDVKKIISSDEFNSSVSKYFDSLEDKMQQTSGRAEEQLCLIIFAAAVLAFASLAVVVVYAVAVFTYWYLYAWSDVDWGGIPFMAKQSLLREQIVNSIATNIVEVE